jgi:hypothetical protein
MWITSKMGMWKSFLKRPCTDSFHTYVDNFEDNYIQNPHRKIGALRKLCKSFLQFLHEISTSYPQNVDKTNCSWIYTLILWKTCARKFKNKI